MHCLCGWTELERSEEVQYMLFLPSPSLRHSAYLGITVPSCVFQLVEAQFFVQEETLTRVTWALDEINDLYECLTLSSVSKKVAGKIENAKVEAI